MGICQHLPGSPTVCMLDNCRLGQLTGAAAHRAPSSAVQVLLNGEAARSDAGDASAPAHLTGGAAGHAAGGPQKSVRRVQLLQPLSDSPPVHGVSAQQQACAMPDTDRSC